MKLNTKNLKSLTLAVGASALLVGCNGLNKMVLTPSKNLYYGFDSESDYTKFRIWTELNYDDIRFRAKFKIGAQVGYPQYVVMYK